MEPFRPDIYVVGRLLGALRRCPEPPRRTQLQQAAGLNYTLFTRYLAFLVQRDLVQFRPDQGSGERIELTRKGEAALRVFSQELAGVLGHVFQDQVDGGRSER